LPVTDPGRPGSPGSHGGSSGPQRSLPWRRPRLEVVLLVLVAIAALSPVYAVNPQDQSRLCLTQALLRGSVSNDSCLIHSFDKAKYGGHLYSDKGPGLSLIELPAAELVRLPDASYLPSFDLHVWAVRVLTSGVAFLVLAFLAGRLAEGIAPGYGGISLVAFALGTIVAPFAAANFAEVPAAAFGFGAFLLVWARRPALAGVLAGTAVLVEYQATALLLIVAVYTALRGSRALVRFAIGAAPPLLLLLAYDTVAFGRPWRLPYHYVSNQYAAQQDKGLFGIGLPHPFGSYAVFSGSGGLLVVSPVLVAAAWGLVLLRRRYPAEVLVAAVVTIVFVVINAGYFLPYGGVSPGPRFLIPCLPFLALGLGPAFARAPRLTAVLAIASIIPMTGLVLIWQTNNPLRQTVWGELARLPAGPGSSRFVHSLTMNIVQWLGLGLGRGEGAALVFLAALGAFLVAVTTMPARRPERIRSGGAAVAIVASVCLLAAADASAFFAYPYGQRTNGSTVGPIYLVPRIFGTTTAALPGGEVDFTVFLSNRSKEIYSGVVLTLRLSRGLELLGPPAYERGRGCVGTTTIRCNLDFLLPGMTTPVRLGTRVAPTADSTQSLSATAVSGEVPANSSAKFDVVVGN
jgi:hypothetical protein